MEGKNVGNLFLVSVVPFDLRVIFCSCTLWFLSRLLSAELLSLLKPKVKCCQPVPHATWQTSMQTPELEEEWRLRELHTIVQNKSCWRLLETTFSLFFCSGVITWRREAGFGSFISLMLYTNSFLELPHITKRIHRRKQNAVQPMWSLALLRAQALCSAS